MSAFLTDWDALEQPLDEKPLFYVEPIPERPADKRKWPEDYRQKAFVSWMRKSHPELLVFSVANERKVSLGHMQKLKATGLVSGIPDIVVLWPCGMAFLEMKGFHASGKAGVLSEAQIGVCNKIHRMGWPVGCFYTAEAARRWLWERGAPIKGF